MSWVATKKKSVYILTTEYHNVELETKIKRINKNKTKELKKPNVIFGYNKNKGGVDTLDQLINNFTTRRKVCRWTVDGFYYLLDVAAYNSFVLFRERNPQIFEKNKERQRRIFLESLAISLIEPQVIFRYNCKARFTPQSITYLYKESLSKIGFMSKEINGSYECFSCKRSRCAHSECKKENNENKYRIVCKLCNKIYCQRHCNIEAFCDGCAIKK